MARPPHPGPTERRVTPAQASLAEGSFVCTRTFRSFSTRPKPAYTSLQTNLQGMLDKGYIHRDVDSRTHVYNANLTQQEVERGAVKHLIKHVFSGSALKLISTTLTSEVTSDEEFARLQMMIEERESCD